MTVGQQRAWDELVGGTGPHRRRAARREAGLPAWFGREAPVMLEIGSGMGETTSQLAAAAPELNYVAVEVYDPGLGQLMLRAEKLGVENLRLLHGDAVVLLTEHVEPERCTASGCSSRTRGRRRSTTSGGSCRRRSPRSWRRGSRPAAPSTWRPTGRTTPSRCSRSAPRNPRCTTGTTAGRRGRSGGR